jgi:hypothetical protein
VTTSELIRAVRRHGATLDVSEDGKLVIAGTGPRLPEQLRAAIAQHRADLLAALSQGKPQSVPELQSRVLAAVRAHHPAWRNLADEDLLCLIDFAVYWRGVEDGRKVPGLPG